MRTRALGSALDCPERPRREREDFFCCGAAGAGSAVWGTGSLAGWVRGFFSPRLPPLRRAGFFSAPFSPSAGISGSEEAVAQATAGMEVLSVHQVGRHKTAAVRCRGKQVSGDVDVSAMNLQNVFVALCGHGDA